MFRELHDCYFKWISASKRQDPFQLYLIDHTYYINTQVPVGNCASKCKVSCGITVLHSCSNSVFRMHSPNGCCNYKKRHLLSHCYMEYNCPGKNHIIIQGRMKEKGVQGLASWLWSYTTTRYDAICKLPSHTPTIHYIISFTPL